MKRGFNFEANLPHQKEAVDSLLNVFEDVQIKKSDNDYQNNIVKFDEIQLLKNIKNIQDVNDIGHEYIAKNEKIFDIHMETGTGKTYTYTKSMFELNKNLGIHKFIVVVPTLAIKAGTVNFLKAKSTQEHFRGLYDKDIKVQVVESQKSKSKKTHIPHSISEFVRANNIGGNIHVLVINSGMINSDTMTRKFDSNLLDKYNVPLEGIKACNVVTIIDEPHKFPDSGKTFKNILDFNSQFIIRFGATFKDSKNNYTYKNLLYSLNSIKAFNQDLVKGISANIISFNDANDCAIKLKETDGTEAIFELDDGKHKKDFKIVKGESLDHIHEQINGLVLENLNKTTIKLDNGLEMKKGDKISPYSYSVVTQNHMMEEAVAKHFELEKKLLTREVKIKPLTLFFIDNISSYRNDNYENGDLANFFEKLVKVHVEKLLETETNEFYKEYLEKTLKDLKGCHGGYFSKDNTGKDDKIEKEINEIIHDKEALLDLDNTRRFIFSKWTLKEGWDNPNVFQICKLRSSGSETSKLQEVGRGLRIPVNEYMERVKDEDFYLNYFVDFTEKDFVKQLQGEIQDNTIIKINEKKLEETLINRICNDYRIEEEELLEELDNKNIINRKNEFKEEGFLKLKELYPLSFESLKNGKIENANKKKKYVTIRKENYNKLKNLWEEINKKVILEYEFENEKQVEEMLYNCLCEQNLYENKLVTTRYDLNKQKMNFVLQESIGIKKTSISSLTYAEFIKELGDVINLNINTIHKVFLKLLEDDKLDINQYLNYETIRIIKNEFKNYLIENVHSEFQIKYNEINNKVHPTVFTEANGQIKDKIEASTVGINLEENVETVKSYLFDELAYDSELEKLNIQEEIKEVIVFTKIPKNSVRIPIVGGYSYSPDFAYVVEYEGGKKQLNFVVETKDKSNKDLSINEEKRIASAEKLYSQDNFNIKFKRQMTGEKIVSLIEEITEKI